MLENQTTGKKRNINLVSDYNISNVSLKIERTILSHIDFVNRVVYKRSKKKRILIYSLVLVQIYRLPIFIVILC